MSNRKLFNMISFSTLFIFAQVEVALLRIRTHIDTWLPLRRMGLRLSVSGPSTVQTHYPLSKGSGTCIKTCNYSWPASCIKTALPKVTVTSLDPVNWGVLYLTVLSPAALGSKSASVFLRRPNRTWTWKRPTLPETVFCTHWNKWCFKKQELLCSRWRRVRTS